jgi:hypothetical protein
MTREELDEVTLMFVGEVEALGEEPPRWSDRYSSWQTVRYRLLAVLKGEAPSAELAVEHGVVKGRPTARRERPGLAPELFGAKARWIVGAEESDGAFYVLYEKPWTAKEEEALRLSVSSLPGPAA